MRVKHAVAAALVLLALTPADLIGTWKGALQFRSPQGEHRVPIEVRFREDWLVEVRRDGAPEARVGAWDLVDGRVHIKSRTPRNDTTLGDLRRHGVELEATVEPGLRLKLRRAQ